MSFSLSFIPTFTTKFDQHILSLSLTIESLKYSKNTQKFTMKINRQISIIKNFFINNKVIELANLFNLHESKKIGNRFGCINQIYFYCVHIQLVNFTYNIKSMSKEYSQSQYETSVNSELNRAGIFTASEVECSPSVSSVRKQQQKESKMKKIAFSDDYDSDEEIRYIISLLHKRQHQQCQTPKQTKSKRTTISINKTVDLITQSGCNIDKICSICLSEFSPQRGSLQCQHQFCFSCIEQWSKTSTICPCCRRPFTSILKLTRSSQKQAVKQIERIPVIKRQLTIESQYDHYVCYQCGLGDNEYVLLICDQCDFYCCHIYCDEELNGIIPQDDWYCIYCRNRRQNRVSQNRVRRRNTQSQVIRQTSRNNGDKGIAARTRSRNQLEMTNNATALRNIRRSRR